MYTHLEQWTADAAAPGSLGVRCLARGSHLSRGQFLPEPRFKPTTSGYKSNALSIRATTAPVMTDLFQNQPLQKMLFLDFLSCFQPKYLEILKSSRIFLIILLTPLADYLLFQVKTHLSLTSLLKTRQ